MPCRWRLGRRDLLLVLASLALAVGLGLGIDPRQPPVLDEQLLHWTGRVLQGAPGELLVQIYRLSGTGFTFVLVLMGLLLVALKRWWVDLRLLAMSTGGILLIIDMALKPLFDRSRPPAKLLPVDGRSFPSGHAAGVVAFYGAMALILAFHYPQWRRPLLLLTGLWMALVWLSTLVVRAHWPSDLLAGAAVGLAWLLICLGCWHPEPGQPEPGKPEPGHPERERPERGRPR